MNIEWFRVINPSLSSKIPTLVVCRDCLGKWNLTIVNRLFGASQTCDKCGTTDKKEG
jgi:hypothetical protein